MEAGQSNLPSPDKPALGPRSLRAHLFALALLVFMPTLAIGVGVAVLAVRDQQRDFTTRLKDGAEAMAVALDRLIEARRVMLSTLVNYAALDEPDNIDDRFVDLARDAAAMLGESITLFRPDFTPIFRTHNPLGLPPPTPPVTTPLQRALETRSTVVSDLITNPYWLVPIVQPVLRGDRVVALLSVRLSRETLLSVLSAAQPESSFVSILDATGRIVARAPENRNIGEFAPEWLRGVLQARPKGAMVQGTTLMGTETIAAVRPIASAPGWSVVIGAPLSAYNGLFQRPLAWLAAGGAAMLGLAIATTLLVSHRLLRPVEALNRHAANAASGGMQDARTIGPFSVTEFEMLRRALAQAEAERLRGEKVQNLLTRELDHRAKNLLAVVEAVIRLTKAESVAEFVKAVSQRIAALARAHSLLSETGWQGSSLLYVAEREVAAYTGAGRITLHGDDVKLTAGAVQSLSLVLHELATNAVKYGALSTPDGRIEVSWSRDDQYGMLHLIWCETGGPPLEGPPLQRGFGSRLTDTAIRGLGGKSKRRWAASGLVFEVWIPLSRVVDADASQRS